MGGLAILFVVGLYVAVALWIVVKSPGWWRLVALIAVILIPTADALWGRYVTLPRLCEDAGLKVYGKASKAHGLMLSTADEYWLTKYGFAFVEGTDGAGRVYRKSMKDDRLILEEDVQSLAGYRISSTAINADGNFPGIRIELLHSATRDVVARKTSYAFRGGWAERQLAHFSDSGSVNVAQCDVGGVLPSQVVKAAFNLGD